MLAYPARTSCDVDDSGGGGGGEGGGGGGDLLVQEDEERSSRVRTLTRGEKVVVEEEKAAASAQEVAMEFSEVKAEGTDEEQAPTSAALAAKRPASGLPGEPIADAPVEPRITSDSSQPPSELAMPAAAMEQDFPSTASLHGGGDSPPQVEASLNPAEEPPAGACLAAAAGKHDGEHDGNHDGELDGEHDAEDANAPALPRDAAPDDGHEGPAASSSCLRSSDPASGSVAPPPAAVTPKPLLAAGGLAARLVESLKRRGIAAKLLVYLCRDPLRIPSCSPGDASRATSA